MEDAEIIRLYFDRSENAVSETARKYGGYLLQTARGVLNDSADSEEVVNDTYLAAWNSIPPKKPEILKYYLARITRNLALKRFDYNRAAKRNSQTDLALGELEECIPDSRTPEDRLEARELGDAINRFLEGRTKENRQIFVSRYFYLRSVPEIAGERGLTRRQVRYRLEAMRRELRAALEKEGCSL